MKLLDLLNRAIVVLSSIALILASAVLTYSVVLRYFSPTQYLGFTVSLLVENATDLASTPMQVRFDPKILRLNDVVRGNLLASDGQQVAFSKNVLNDTGEATVNVSRFPTTGGVTGSGSIVTLVFQAVGHGDTVITVPQLVLRNSQSQPILTASPQLAVTIK